MSGREMGEDFDPTARDRMGLRGPFPKPMIGKAPAGFAKIRVEMKPHELMKIIGYDPRGLQSFKKGSKIIEPSRHVSQTLVELQKEIQRSIDPDKVAEMVDYLHAAISNNKYADWAELDAVTVARPNTSRF